MIIKLDEQQKQKFFDLALEKNFLDQEFIDSWGFLSANEFWQNGHLSLEQFCQLISDVTAMDYQALYDQLHEVKKQKLKESKVDIEKKAEVIEDDPLPVVKKISIKKTKSGIQVAKKTSEKLSNDKLPQVPKLSKVQIDERWKQGVIEEVEERIDQHRKLMDNIEEQTEQNKSDNLVFLALFTAYCLALFFKNFRIIILIVSFLAIVIYLTAFLIQILITEKKEGIQVKVKDTPLHRLLRKTVPTKKTMTKNFIQDLPSPKKRRNGSAIAFIIIAFSAFTITLTSIFQLIMIIALGIGAAHLTEKRKGIDGAKIYCLAYAVYLLICQVFITNLADWFSSMFGFFCFSFSFLLTANFGMIIVRNIELQEIEKQERKEQNFLQ